MKASGGAISRAERLVKKKDSVRAVPGKRETESGRGGGKSSFLLLDRSAEEREGKGGIRKGPQAGCLF